MNKSVKMLSETCSAHLPGWLAEVARFYFIYVLLQLNKIFKAFWGKKVPDELKIQGQISGETKQKKTVQGQEQCFIQVL